MKLTPEVKRMLEYGDLEMGHARALLALDSERQISAAKEVVAKGLSVRQTEELIRKLQELGVTQKKPLEADPAIMELEKIMAQAVGSRVKISHSEKGKGKLTINYENREELDRIIQLMQ
jgi:ParB family chromosome partitioning protein